MFKLIAVVLLCGLSAAARAPQGVPKEATEVSPGVWRHVSEGKTWIYRHTPFGYQKRVEEPAAETKAETPAAPARVDASGRLQTPFGEMRARPAAEPQTRVTENGDSLVFERPNPFGTSRWTRKKTELTEAEKALWDAQRNSAAKTDSK